MRAGKIKWKGVGEQKWKEIVWKWNQCFLSLLMAPTSIHFLKKKYGSHTLHLPLSPSPYPIHPPGMMILALKQLSNPFISYTVFTMLRIFLTRLILSLLTSIQHETQSILYWYSKSSMYVVQLNKLEWLSFPNSLTRILYIKQKKIFQFRYKLLS